MIAEFEGLRLSAYKCAGGKWTIGFGHTDGVKQGDTCTEEQAYKWLDLETKIFREAVDHAVDVELSHNQMEALTSLCYNIGTRAFTNSTLVKKLNEGDLLGAAMEFPKWSKAGGKRLKGLLRRRLHEATCFLE